MSGSSQYKFGVLAKIVKHLKNLHQNGGDQALTLDEILDETNQLDVSIKIPQASLYYKKLIDFVFNVLFI